MEMVIIFPRPGISPSTNFLKKIVWAPSRCCKATCSDVRALKNMLPACFFAEQKEKQHIAVLFFFLLRDQGSNLEPTPYTYPNVTKRGGLYHHRF